MQLLYGQSAFHFYTLEVAKLLAQSQQLKNKIETSLYNVRRLSEQTTIQIAEMRVIAKEREDARVFYDHYRTKTVKLEKEA